jgi:DMSO/TMAO reductase YedYZ heme-binding membrane subunit
VSARYRYPPAGRPGGTTRSRGGTWILASVLLAGGCAALAAGGLAQDRVVLAAVQRFMLAYSGVFALVSLTAAVAAGLVATDRVIMTPAGRVVSQGVHRALSLAAAGFLATHVLLEILAHRSRPVDAVAPFLASGRTLYLGLGTLASDLVLIILATGVARHRFAAGRPGAWRAVHVTAYLAWPLAIAHGLLAGRQPRPYVDWSYGGCLLAVALALLIRLVTTPRGRTQAARRPRSGPRRAAAAYRDPYGSPAARLAAWPRAARPPAAARPAAARPAAPPALPRAIPPPRGPHDGSLQRGGIRATEP